MSIFNSLKWTVIGFALVISIGLLSLLTYSGGLAIAAIIFILCLPLFSNLDVRGNE